MKACFDTYGCRLNLAESLQLAADYKAAGWEIVDDHASADLIVLRGCSVTSTAQRECEHAVRHLREKHPSKQLLVLGCLDPKVKRCGTRVSRAATEITQDAGIPDRNARAYLKVQDGCTGRCTFCTVPKFRGKSASVPFAKVLEKAKRFIDFGYREIVVTGCNLVEWKEDGKGFADLVAALAEIDPRCRIRLGSVEPTAEAKRVVATMAAHENVCRYLHLPVQSGSERLIKMMRRPYSARDVVTLVDEARRSMPNIAICCDLMAGFPGERAQDFKDTTTLVARCRFAKAHVFPFSARPGTAAALSENKVSHPERVSRARKLQAQVDKIRGEFAESFVGKTVEIVVENAQKAAGWTGEYLWCASESVLLGQAVRRERLRMKVVGVSGDQLIGRIED